MAGYRGQCEYGEGRLEENAQRNHARYKGGH